MTISNTAAIAASHNPAILTNTETTSTEIEEAFVNALKSVMELRGLVDMLEITTRMMYLPDLTSCSYAHRSAILLAHKGYRHIHPLIESLSALGEETRAIHARLKDAETIFVVLSTPRKLSYQNMFASLLLVEDAESALKAVERIIKNKLSRLRATQNLQSDSSEIPETYNEYGLIAKPFFRDSSISARFDLMATLAGMLIREIFGSEGSERLLEHDQADFCEHVRMLKKWLQRFRGEIQSNAFKERMQVAIRHLGFLDKLFANGVTFNANDVHSVDLIAEEIVAIIGELSDEISQFELKQKAGGDLDDTVH